MLPIPSQEALLLQELLLQPKRLGHFEFRTLRRYATQCILRGKLTQKSRFFFFDARDYLTSLRRESERDLNKSQELGLPFSVDFSWQQVAGDLISTSSTQVSVQETDTSGGAVPTRKNERIKQGT